MLALSAQSPHTSAVSVVTVDLRTGERLGSVTSRGQFITVAGSARSACSCETPPSAGSRCASSTARPARWAPGGTAGIPDSQGSRLSELGGHALVYGWGRRLTVIPRSGAPLVADSLGLAAAAHIVGVPGGRFAAGRD